MDKTYIPGKDEALEVSIEHMRSLLHEHGFKVEESSWLNPVSGVWSVHLRECGCPRLYTNGKGATEKAALASALGEFFERLSTNFFFAEYYLGPGWAEFVHYPEERWFPAHGRERPEGLLGETLWEFYDCEGELTAEHLIDTNSYDPGRGICALPFVRQRDGETVWFPVAILNNLYVSNGMASGNSIPEARVQAMSEIMERYVKNRVISQGTALPEVPREVLDRFAHIRQSLDELNSRGFPVFVRDASLGGNYPVINITLFCPDKGACLPSFGSHPRFEVALERTLTELLQGRTLDRLDVAQPPTFDMDAVSDQENLEIHFIDSSGLLSWKSLSGVPDYPFCAWDRDASTADDFSYMVNLVQESGHDAYIADYRHLGRYACRIVVPGMSEIYPPGDLLWGNNNAGAPLRERILNLPELESAMCEELYRELESGDFPDAQPVPNLVGVAADPGTAWATLRVGELKCMLAMACGNHPDARNWCEWCLHFAELGGERRRLYDCLNTLLAMTGDPGYLQRDYRKALDYLYGAETVNICGQWLGQKIRFPGLHSAGMSLKGFDMHRRLLDAYRKLHAAKLSASGKFTNCSG